MTSEAGNSFGSPSIVHFPTFEIRNTFRMALQIPLDMTVIYL